MRSFIMMFLKIKVELAYCFLDEIIYNKIN